MRVPRVTYPIVAVVAVVGGGTAIFMWLLKGQWLDKDGGPLVGAFVGFLAATLFRYWFDRVRDIELEDSERRAVAAALLGELRAIHRRCTEHLNWLHKLSEAPRPTGRAAKKIVDLPEIYPIYDTKIYEASLGKIGFFDAETARLLASVYDHVLTCARRADRYVKIPIASVLNGIPHALVRDVQPIVTISASAIERLATIAGISPGSPEAEGLVVELRGPVYLLSEPTISTVFGVETIEVTDDRDPIAGGPGSNKFKPHRSPKPPARSRRRR